MACSNEICYSWILQRRFISVYFISILSHSSMDIMCASTFGLLLSRRGILVSEILIMYKTSMQLQSLLKKGLIVVSLSVYEKS